MTNYKYHYPYNNRTFHRFAFTTSWKRQPQYYLSKIVAGTMLLVWMCIWNFSLQIDEPDRSEPFSGRFCGGAPCASPCRRSLCCTVIRDSGHELTVPSACVLCWLPVSSHFCPPSE